ncbi:MAG: SPASM domain-containing protein, partial [Oscillospiraceae bacterium]
FRVCLTTNGVLLPRQTALLLSAPALHKVSVSLHSFEGNEGGALLPYLNDVWDFVHQAAAQGIICVLRLWNGGGAEDCNQTILDFLVEKTGVAATAWGCPRPGTRRLDDHLFLEYAAKFDWPEQTAPTADTEFCYALREQVAVLADGTVVPCCLDHEGDLALGNLFHQTAEDILSCRRARAIYDGFSQRQPAEELCRRCGYATRFSL